MCPCHIQLQSTDPTNDDALAGQSDTPITSQPVEVVDETKLVVPLSCHHHQIFHSNSFVNLVNNCAVCTENYLFLFLVYICLHINLKNISHK